MLVAGEGLGEDVTNGAYDGRLVAAREERGREKRKVDKQRCCFSQFFMGFEFEHTDIFTYIQIQI